MSFYVAFLARSVAARVAAVVAVVAVVMPAWTVPARAAAVAAIVVQPDTGLLNGQQVTVTGSGFPAGTLVYLAECNDTPGQPTVGFATVSVPVSCSDPQMAPGGASVPVAGGDGSFTGTFTVMTGVTGPIQLGLDSAGRPAAADAALYPCPPTAAQQAAGAACRIYAGEAPSYVAPGPSLPPGQPSLVSADAVIAFGAPRSFSPVAGAVPATGLSSGDRVSVTGSGFTPDSPGVVIECNRTPGEPVGQFGVSFLPVGCTPWPQSFPSGPPGAVPVGSGGAAPVAPASAPVAGSASFTTDDTGAMSATVTIREGNLGGSAASGAYPCPPTAAQVAAGASCQLFVRDDANDTVWVRVSITGPVPMPSVTVVPSSGLYGGEQVEVSGANFYPLGQVGIVECSDAAGQPTISFAGFDIAVSCTAPGKALTAVSPDGSFQTVFTIATGVTGPPVPGPDSAGRDAGADAAAYPCPPTPAQKAEGDSCYLGVGDLAGDSTRADLGLATGRFHLAGPIVAIAPRPDGTGYWLAGSDGGVFAFGSAGYYGSAAGIHLARPVVGMAPTPDGRGYWLAGSEGGVFTYGDAGYYGSAAGIRLAGPVVGMASTPDGRGYWLVGSDGGVFTFGDAVYYGSAGRTHLAGPVVGMASTPDGRGYWLVGSDGGVFTYGDAGFYGSGAGTHMARPVVGIAATRSGKGYLLAAADAAVSPFGDAASPVSGIPPPPTPTGAASGIVASAGGYWVCTATGQVTAGGTAPPLGALSPG